MARLARACSMRESDCGADRTSDTGSGEARTCSWGGVNINNSRNIQALCFTDRLSAWCGYRRGHVSNRHGGDKRLRREADRH